MAEVKFDAAFYYASKAAQLNALNDGAGYGEHGNQWDAAKVEAFFTANGIDPEVHFVQFGQLEGVDPAANFDVSAYFEAKAEHCNKLTFEGKSGWTAADVAQYFVEHGIDPIEHWNTVGVTEGLSYTPGGEVAPEVPGGEATEETQAIDAALSAYQEAVEAQAAYEESAGMTAAEAGTALDEAATAVDGLSNTDNVSLKVTLTSNNAFDTTLTDAIITEALDIKRAELEKAVETAEAALNETDASVKEATALSKAATTFEEASNASYEANAKATSLETAYLATAAAAGKTAGLCDSKEAAKTLDDIFGKVADGVYTPGTFDVTGKNSAGDLIYVDPDNNAQDAASVTPLIKVTATGELALADGIKDDAVAEALLAALQAKVDAMAKEAAAYDAVLSAVQRIDDTVTSDTLEDAGVTVTASSDGTDASVAITGQDGAAITVATAALITAQENLDAFEAAVTEFNSAKTVVDKYAELTEAVEAAQAAIEDAPDAGLGLSLFTLEEGDTAAIFTKDNDVLDITGVADLTDKLTVEDFGFEGVDWIKVGATNLVDLSAEGKAITDSVGLADALEVFYVQDGDDLKMYVELDAAAGNLSTTDRMVEVTLAGVQIADVTFVGGFMTAGEASA